MIKARSRAICECGVPKVYHSADIAKFHGFIWDKTHPFKAATYKCDDCGERIYAGDLYHREQRRRTGTFRYCEPCARQRGHS